MFNQDFLNEFFPREKKRFSYELIIEVVHNFHGDFSVEEMRSIDLDRPIDPEKIKETLQLISNIDEVFNFRIEKRGGKNGRWRPFRLESDGSFFGYYGGFLPKHIIKKAQPIIDAAKSHPKLNSFQNKNVYPTDEIS